jgi:hypothetical protein
MRDRPTSVACGLSTLANLLLFCDKNAAAIVRAGTVSEIRQAREQGKIAHLSGWQSALPLLEMPMESWWWAGCAHRQLGLRIAAAGR